MSYAVAWEPDATDDVDAAWSAASPSLRRAIETALGYLQRQLSTAPILSGESRNDDFDRVITALPLTVRCRIDPRLRLVRVVSVQVYRMPQ